MEREIFIEESKAGLCPYMFRPTETEVEEIAEEVLSLLYEKVDEYFGAVKRHPYSIMVIDIILKRINKQLDRDWWITTYYQRRRVNKVLGKDVTYAVINKPIVSGDMSPELRERIFRKEE